MEVKLFKKFLNDAMLTGSFLKQGSYYYRDGEECVCIVGLQKSEFSSAYYINVGFVLKGLHEISEKLKDSDGDVRTRFTYFTDGKKVNLFDLEKFSDSDELIVKESISQNLNELIEPALKPGGIKTLLKERPILLYQTTVQTKRFLGVGVE